MIDTEKVRAGLVAQFDFLAGHSRTTRARRVWAEVPYERFREVLEFADRQMGFSHLCTITGLDEGETLAVLYHIARPEDGVVLTFKTGVPKANPVLQTVSSLFPDSIIYERELVDLLGMQVQGLPEGKRYPLPDGWPQGQYPLRKDWTAEILDAAATQEKDDHA